MTKPFASIAPPRLGEQTDEFLAEPARAAGEIDTLWEEGVV
jgi:hypothetical protein